jgi:hypothetical protein
MKLKNTDDVARVDNCRLYGCYAAMCCSEPTRRYMLRWASCLARPSDGYFYCRGYSVSDG